MILPFQPLDDFGPPSRLAGTPVHFDASQKQSGNVFAATRLGDTADPTVYSLSKLTLHFADIAPA
jgi:hypothetical protein